MIHALDLSVTLALGTSRRAIPARELARLLGLPDLPARLLAVLLALDPDVAVHSPSTREKGVGGRERHALFPGTNGISNLRFRSFSEGGKEGSGEPSGATAATPVDNVADSSSHAERLAGYLADRLDDRKSLAFYALVASVVPREVVSVALARAIDLPAREVRRSRAAYFTAIVRPYLSHRSAPTKHAS